MKHFLTCTVILFFGFRSFSQLAIYQNSLGVRMHYGFIHDHTGNLDLLITGHIPAFEIYYKYTYTGTKEWQKFYNYPNVGVAFKYVDFRNSQIGSAYSLIPYMGFPLFKNKFSLFEFRLGAGLGVFSNRFNLETNLKNSAISSRINSAVNFLFQYSVNITNRSELLAGFSLTHWSNAAFEIPNAGINVFGANLGVNIDIGKRVPINYQSFPIVEKNWHFMSWIGIYLKETNPVDRGKYVAGTLGFDALKRFSRKSSFGAGLNLMYDRTLNVRDPNLNTPFRVGITLCYELHAGRISFPIQQGFYVYDAFGKDAIIYQRIGVKYRVRKNLFVNFTLKTHYAVADYAELGFGYLIK